MSKVRARDARKLEKSLKAHRLSKAQYAEAWRLLREEDINTALTYVTETALPPVLTDPVPYDIWGSEHVDAQAIAQMQAAARLPIAVQGALMPDAHVGYGLPIGGVLATENTVIPYAVGVDIACRMRLTIFDVEQKALQREVDFLKDTLMEQTRFGSGSKFDKEDRWDHPVLASDAWQATGFLKGLHSKAVEQLGTSGGGNHFVEWGTFTLDKADPSLGVERPGTYVALLSHSGSRGVGYQIANRYSKLARDDHPYLPEEVKHLAWFSLDSELGQEYWLSMELAGEFASANHAVIHERIAKASDFPVLAVVENHHNFAWKETIGDQEVIVHRKGATPAGQGVLGVIPGSMGDPGFVVRGKGSAASINSASHGAGRKMSRRKAKQSITRKEQKRYLKERGVELLGGGLDEAPQAYKSIHDVLNAQTDLVDVVGEFQPRIVRMAND